MALKSVYLATHRENSIFMVYIKAGIEIVYPPHISWVGERAIYGIHIHLPTTRVLVSSPHSESRRPILKSVPRTSI